MALILIAGILGGNPFWFLTEDLSWSGILLIVGSSYLTLLFISTRIWLHLNPSKAFTWASILTMTLFILPVFPMIAELTEGTSYRKFVVPLWVFPGTVLFMGDNYGFPGSLTVLVFFVLLIEVLARKQKQTDPPNK